MASSGESGRRCLPSRSSASIRPPAVRRRSASRALVLGSCRAAASRRRAVGCVRQELLRSDEGRDYARPAAEGGARCEVPSYSASRTSGLLPRERVVPVPADKRKVENPVRYPRGDFVYGSHVPARCRLDHQRRRGATAWPMSIGWQGTTRERPHDRFDREQRFLLQWLLGRRYTSLTSIGRVRTPASRARPDWYGPLRLA